MPLKSRLKKLLRHDRSSSSATPAPETAPAQGSFAASSASLEPNYDPNPSPSPINDPQLTIPEGLWGEAYENLRTENAELLNAYENILLLNWHSEDNDAEGKESTNSRLRALVNNRLEELQKSRLKFNVAGKEVVVKDEVHRALKSILSVNNFITTAVSSDPHASLAWAGVLVLLNPIAQSATQDEDAMQGFERVASLLSRYRVMEQSWIKVYSFKTATEREGSIEKLNISIRSQTVRLYTAILKFQMRLAKHYLKSGVYRFLEDVIAVNDWNGMMQTITDLDKYITDDLRALSDQTLQDIQNKMNDLQNDLGGLLDLTSEARDEAKAAKQAEQLNSLSYARNAAFNTYESQQRSGCHPGTQVNILRGIKEWCESPGGEVIYWLNGMAGTGKSTISYTLAAACCSGEALVDDAKLSHSVFFGASFFFKHNEAEQNNGKKLFTTICRQLADLLPEVRSDISNSISSHSNISNEVMSNQWESLILRPLLALDKRGLVPLNFIVVIDALDECLPEDASTLIRLITEAGKLNNIRLRFFITSRPEPHIIKWFENCKGSVSKMELPKVTVKKQSHSPTFKNDITRFLEVELADIGTSHGAPDGWPGETAIENLTLKSDGLFIYAATACRFLNESGRNRRRLQHRMDIIFDDKLVAKSPGGGLNTMYSKILISSFGANLIEEERIDLHQRFKQVVGSIIMLCEPLSPIDLSNILGCSREDVDDTLDGLSSVLSKGEDHQKPISLLHLSFRDFLLDQTCNEQFRINPKISHEALLESCLEVMAKGLRRNICGLEDESILAESVQPSLVNLHIHGHLQYACRYWVDHLQKSAIQTLSDDGGVHCFLKEHFLHWLEAMSLMRKMSEGVQAILRLHEYITGLPSDDISSLREMTRDARRFVLSFPAIIGHSPLQVYHSALVYAPQRSVIRTHFQDSIPKSIVGFPEVEEDWSPLLQAIPDHRQKNWAWSRATIAFSPDGKLIASPSVCLWDVNTGALLKSFDPLGCPRYVAFLDNGERIMALSMEGNVRVWDVSSGVLLQEVNMCVENCRAILSHDKTTMACYLGDTVKVIAIATERLILSFEVHSERRGDLEISQDNRLLACGFDDGSVQLWNNDTGRMQHELIHHTSPVVHVAFSGDATLVLSVSQDGTLDLWDTDTGVLQKSFNGPILDAIFSLDSKAILYTAKELDRDDSLFCVCSRDIESSVHVKKMSSKLRGLRISPDGKFATSVPVVCERSRSSTTHLVPSNVIQVCDTASGELIKTLGSHSDQVLDVIFSPDAKFMASYAQDKTVRIWDLSASQPQEKRDKHDSAVVSMFLSASSELISLSSSYDKVFKFWDVKARASLQQELLARCNGPVEFTADYEFQIESEDNAISIVEGATGKCVRSFKHENSFSDEYSFHSHTRLLGKSRRFNLDDENEYDTVLRNDIPIVKIWDIDSGTALHTLYGPREQTIRLKFSPDGQLLALQRSLAGITKEIEIWDVKRWKLHQKLEQDEARGECDLDFIWSPDGAMVGILFNKRCSDESREISQFDIWNLNTGRLVTLFEQTFYLDGELYPRIYKLMFSVFSEDGKLATADGSESIIQLWNIKTGEMIGQRQFTSLEERYYSSTRHTRFSFSGDSQTLMTRHGRLDVRSFDPDWDGVESRDLFVDDGWVFQGQKKILLLPHDYRPTCVLAVDNTLVMGHASGHVTFLALAPQDSSE